MNNPNLIRTALHYGALSGIAAFMFFMGMYAVEMNVFGPGASLGIWIPVVFIVMATRYHRDQNLKGYITYRQGLTVGICTSLFSASLFGLCFYLFTSLYAPELLEAYRAQAAASFEEGKSLFSESLIDKAMENIELTTLGSLAFNESLSKLVWGTLVSLVVAGIMKKKPPMME